ncbi:MAG: hypothetical protein V4568_16180, partial [Pseudomonadota bacterium]
MNNDTENLLNDIFENLIRAAENGITTEVKTCLAAIRTQASTDTDYDRAIWQAMQNGHDDIVELLLEDKLEIIKNAWKVRNAVRTSDQAALHNLFKTPEKIDLPLTLLFASEDGSLDILNLLLNNAPTLDRYGAAQKAIMHSQEGSLRALLLNAPPSLDLHGLIQYANATAMNSVMTSLLMNSIPQWISMAAAQGHALETVEPLIRIAPDGTDLSRALFLAISNNNSEFAFALLGHEQSPSSLRNAWNLTAAVQENHQHDINVYLDEPELNCSLAIALIMATSKNHDDLINELFERQSNSFNNELVLEAAVTCSRKQVVDRVLQNRPSFSMTAFAFQLAHSNYGSGNAIKNALANYFVTEFDSATKNNDIATVSNILTYLPNVDFRAPLFNAVVHGNRDIINLLIKKYGQPTYNAIVFWDNAKSGKTSDAAQRWKQSETIDRSLALALVTTIKNSDRFVKWLLQPASSQNVNCSFAIEMAVFRQDKTAIDTLIENASPYPDLRQAIKIAGEIGNNAIKRRLIAHIATAIESCTTQDNVDAINKLLDNAPENMGLVAHAIYSAARNNKPPFISALLGRASPAIQNAYTIFRATLEGKDEEVDTILSKQPDIDRALATALIVGNSADHDDKIEKLLPDASSAFNHSLLFEAAIVSKNEAILHRVLESSPSLFDIRQAFDEAEKTDNDVMRDSLETHVIQRLGNAIEKNDENTVKEICEEMYAHMSLSVSLDHSVVDAAVLGHDGIVEMINGMMRQHSQKAVALWRTALRRTKGTEGALDNLLNDPDLDRSLALALMVPIENNKNLLRAVVKNAHDVGYLLNYSLAFHAAISLKDQPTIEELLKVVPPDIHLIDMITKARKNGLTAITNILTAHVSRQLKTLAENGDKTNILNILKITPAIVDLRPAIEGAKKKNHTDIANLLTTHLTGQIQEAAFKGWHDKLKELLQHAPENENIDYRQAITYAALKKDYEIVAEMMDKAPMAIKNAAQLFFAAKKSPADKEEIAKLLSESALDHGLALAMVITLPDPSDDLIKKLLKKTRDFSLALEVPALTGDEVMIEKLLNSRLRNTTFQNALHYAAARGHAAIVTQILESAPSMQDVNGAIVKAEEANHSSVVDLLVEHFNLELTEAAQKGLTKVVAQLLDGMPEDQEIDIHSAVNGAAHNGYWSTVTQIFQSTSEEIDWEKIDLTIAILLATQNGHDKAVMTILEAQPSISNQIYALENAALLGRPSLVTQLMDKYGSHIICDKALENAAQKNGFDIVAIILARASVRPNVSNALTTAAAKGYNTIVAKFLQYAPEADCLPALATAATQGRKETVELILNVAPKNIAHHVSMLDAMLQGHYDVADLIASHADDSVKAAWEFRSAMENDNRAVSMSKCNEAHFSGPV